MILFYKAGACSLAPHIVLQELGLSFTLEDVDLRAKTYAGGKNFLEINPKGQIPVLKVNDELTLTECATILQYLADQAPQSGLLPEMNQGAARYQVLEWVNYIATELHKSYTPLFNPRLSDAAKAECKQLLPQKLDGLNAILEGKMFLVGERFSIADAYLFNILCWGMWVDLPLDPWPNLMAFSARIQARASVQAALAAEKNQA